jgi:hypothetical protein
VSPLPTWIRKSFLVIFTILTFGLVTPPQIIIAEQKSNESSNTDHYQDNQLENKTLNPYIDNYSESTPSFFEYAIIQAEQQSIMKFGPIIEDSIGDEFKTVILPKIEEVIMTLSSRLNEEQLQNLVISKQPTGGLSEKIFHIYDAQQGHDIIRFHVRRDHPPLEGYYFNFHYHTFEDAFQMHHELGTIYWDKNTPPNWRS